MKKNRNIKKQPAILIVEDTEIIMYLLKSFIKKTIPGAEIIESANADEGVYKYKKFNPDIVLLNIQLPEKNGYYVLEEIRNYEKENNFNNKPVIAITARNIKGEKAKCLNAGMNDFLAKPIDKDLLKYTIIKNLSSKSYFYKKKPANEWYKSEKIESNHFDKQGLIKRLDGNTDQYKKLISMAIPHIHEYILNLKTAINNYDFDDIELKAHKLKGAALFMCFYQLAEIAEKIEYNIEPNIIKINKLFSQINNEFENVKREVKGE